MMDGNILYVNIGGLVDLDTGNTGMPLSTRARMREAFACANKNQCAGLLLNLRNNMAGEEDMVAEMPVLYIEPDSQRYGGQIIAIVNSQCVSRGEGVALGISNFNTAIYGQVSDD